MFKVADVYSDRCLELEMSIRKDAKVTDVKRDGL